jgi:NAD(P)-dependent dehydrogenase (short-subunit alcohol dehydrogenase family)
MLLSDKVAIVTGAGSGIGRASAIRFATEGAAVVVADVRGYRAERVVQEIVAGGGRAVASEIDVGDESGVAAMVDLATGQFGNLDVLFSNAAVSLPGTALDLTTSDWDAMWRTNVSSLFFAAKHAIPRMAERGGGAIVATSSISGLTADGGQVGYAATKAAVMGLVRALAVDHSRDGIRVNCVCPGMTATPPMLHALGEDRLRSGALDAPAMGRLAEPEEIAAAVVWLASDQASYLTGQSIVVDGGLGAESQFSRLLRMH